MPLTSNPAKTAAASAPLSEILTVRRELHDLSNVLTGLLITAGLLKNFVPLPGNGARYASDIEGSAQRAASLADQIRERIHWLQGAIAPAELEDSSTKVCDVRPSLGQKTGEN